MQGQNPQIPDIEIVEVSPRDGLQNESQLFSTDQKLHLINAAIDAGVKRIEVASFVHPKRVPQMADAEAVCAGLSQREDVTYIGLVLNQRGLDRAIAAGVDEAGCVVSASDGFGQNNQGQSSQESVDIASAMIEKARAAGLAANVTISVAFGCPFDGEVSSQRVVKMAKTLAQAKPHEIAIADTIGVANPWQVTDLINAVKKEIPNMPLRMHFHNTRNTGIANAYAAAKAGVQTLDSSIGGIGGCPFAPAATGNIPTEDLLYMLERAGVQTGLDLEKINQTAKWLSETMQRPVPGMVSKAGGFPK
ncbi:MAG: hydroxymethylglutaryl-CoA lyase [Gammaproteobacteria bacterium]|nr:hydroxymethylglutaryl-CoA lyase [Gammaproteobacteria bacterium]